MLSKRKIYYSTDHGLIVIFGYNYIRGNIMDMDIDDIIFRIGYFRNKTDISARELSLKLNKNITYINHLECKNFNIKLSALLEILDILNVSPEEFFAKDYTHYKENQKLAKIFEGLSQETKTLLLELIKKLK